MKEKDIIHDGLSYGLLFCRHPKWALLSKKQSQRYKKQQNAARYERRFSTLAEKYIRNFIPRAKCVGTWDDTKPWSVRGNIFLVTSGSFGMSFDPKYAISDACSTPLEAWKSAINNLASVLEKNENDSRSS